MQVVYGLVSYKQTINCIDFRPNSVFLIACSIALVALAVTFPFADLAYTTKVASRQFVSATYFLLSLTSDHINYKCTFAETLPAPKCMIILDQLLLPTSPAHKSWLLL